MAHVELSSICPPVAGESLRGWGGLVHRAPEPCLVLDRSGHIVACSRACAYLLGVPDAVAAVGRPLLDGATHLVDFTAAGSRLSEWELGRVPPLLALTTGGLARGLLRLRSPHGIRTVDAVATPLRDGADVAGSLTFFLEI